MLIDDQVRCPYHGLKFDCTGTCTDNPHGKHSIPRELRVPSYTLVERDGILWIWMGDAPADPSSIPDFGVLNQPDIHRTIRRHIMVDADYRLITDNLLDLSHVVYVHTAIGSSSLLENESNRAEQKGQRIWSRRKNEAITAAPFYHLFQPAYATVKVDKQQNMRWDVPSNMLLEIVHHETGKPDSMRIVNYGANILTPESDRRTHYFWTVSRNFALDNRELDEKMEKAVYHAFAMEDKKIIEAQQAMMDLASLKDLQPVLIETDVAATRARRVLSGLIAKEASAVGRIPIAAVSDAK